MSFYDLTGMTAIVTGAATGIGLAIADRFARAGARVAIADLDCIAATNSAATVRNSIPVHMDVTEPASVADAVASVLSKCGRIDVLVNNAGVAGRAAPLWELTFPEWQHVINVNLFGLLHCCRAVVPCMRAQRYGRIVNIASVAGKEGNPNMTAYSASKAGVIGLTKALAKELATESICVNAISPAVVRTRLLEQLTPQQVDYMVERIPMRRTGEPEEVAAVAHFLASRDCSFVTGQCYDASGGRSTY